jgi:hypothetical protein
MGQLRELYGDRLDDPQTVLELVVALPAPGADRSGSADDDAPETSTT